ncbi:MAG: hypothetical protein K2P81_09870 [Bacteriovoracaceae bacterium]|nr:hypothetical protein [Bacteriovoracaceae bacterium]
MKSAIAALITLASGDYSQHVNQVIEQRPLDEDKIRHVELLNTDYVIHYEQAVILGTTAAYEEQTKIWHFDQMLKAVDKNCSPEIDLAGCVHELVCSKAFPHNFDLRIMICD